MIDDTLFYELFENLTSGCAIYEVQNHGLNGRDYIIKGFNKKSREIEGKTEAEVIGKSLLDIRPNIDEFGLIDIFRKVWETGESAIFPSTQYIDETYSSWYENYVFRLKSGEIVAIYSDVSDYENTKLKLMEQNKILESYFDNAPYGIIIVDAELKVVDANEAFAEITGYKYEDLLTMKMTDFYLANDKKGTINRFKILKNSGYLESEAAFKKEDGTERSWSIRSAIINDNRYIGFFNDITDRKFLENELFNAKEEYQALFDSAGLGIGYYDTNGRVKWYNKVAAANMGGIPEDFRNLHILDIFPKTGKLFLKRIDAALVSDHPMEYEDELQLNKGSVVFKSTFNCITNSKNEKLGVQIISQDITKIRSSEKALIESEKKFRLMFLDAPVAYQSLDVNGMFIDVNNMWLKLLGYSYNEVIGRWFGDFLEEKYIDVFKVNFPLFKEKGATCKFFHMKRKDGSILTIKFDGLILYDELGEFNRTQCVLQDITPQTIAEADLKESEYKYRSMIDLSPIGICNINPDGTIFKVNDACCRILGYKMEELEKLSFISLIHPEETNKLKTLSLKVNSGEKVEYMQQRFIKKDGSIVYIILSSMMLNDRLGKPLFTITSLQDITPRIELEKTKLQMQEYLKNQQKLESLGNLAGGVAHEINNPINGIMNYCDILLDSGDFESENTEYINEIYYEAKRISTIVSDLLKFSRQSEKSDNVIDLNEIIRHTKSLINTIIQYDGITLTITPSKDDIAVIGNGNQIQQVFMNLLINARDSLNEKFSGYDADKIINMKCLKTPEKEGAFIRISVEDHGTGISPEIIDNIFDPFFTTKDVGKGTGLGLSISYGIIKEFGGEITCESQFGEKTVFHIDLPIKHAD